MPVDVVTSSGNKSDAVAGETGAVARKPPISPSVAHALLGVFDAVGFLASGWALVAATAPTRAGEWRLSALVVLLGAIVAVEMLRIAGAYIPDDLSRRSRSPMRDAILWTVAIMGVVTVLAAFEGFANLKPQVFGWLGLWLLAGLAIMAVGRAGLAALSAQWERTGRLARTVAIVGAGPLGERLLSQFKAAGESRVRVAGVYDDRHPQAELYCLDRRVAGSIDDLVVEITKGGINEVVIALSSADEQRLAVSILKLSAVPVVIRLCDGALSFQPQPGSVSRLGDVTLVDVIETPLADWRGLAKAIEDRILAALGLVVFGPIMLAIALAIRLDSPGAVLFRQRRLGLNNHIIEVLKFRTMYEEVCDPNADSLTRRNDPRVTRLGAVLRRTMLDELPQLINVLRGEMSVVGPRPHALGAKAGGLLYPDAVPQYHARHRMKPGMTGWAQVNGWRGTTDTLEEIEKRVECDLHYVENWSLRFDFEIIGRTALLPFANHDEREKSDSCGASG